MRSWPLPVPDRPLEPPVDPPREAAPRYGVSPLHRQLLADGFVAWQPGERLFSLSSAVASKRLLRRFAKMGLGEGKVVHSLRHTFKTAARGVMG
jgi:hypothetical protein